VRQNTIEVKVDYKTRGYGKASFVTNNKQGYTFQRKTPSHVHLVSSMTSLLLKPVNSPLKVVSPPSRVVWEAPPLSTKTSISISNQGRPQHAELQTPDLGCACTRYACICDAQLNRFGCPWDRLCSVETANDHSHHRTDIPDIRGGLPGQVLLVFSVRSCRDSQK
jgi:hypothetical protein